MYRTAYGTNQQEQLSAIEDTKNAVEYILKEEYGIDVDFEWEWIEDQMDWACSQGEYSNMPEFIVQLYIDTECTKEQAHMIGEHFRGNNIECEQNPFLGGDEELMYAFVDGWTAADMEAQIAASEQMEGL